MKNLTEYIYERNEQVWVIKDKDLDGAILDICDTEEAAKEVYDSHMKENEDNHLEISTCKRSEVENKK